MKLIIDIGNTNILLAVFEDTKGYPSAKIMQRLYTHVFRTDDEYVVVIKSMFEHTEVDIEKIDYCLISSVVPKLTAVIARAIHKLLEKKPTVLSPALYNRLPVAIPQSAVHEIGTDILANAVSAYSRYKSACIAVDFGTALTFVAVDEDAKIQGVAIAPGMMTAVNSLFTNTAQLPSVPLEVPESAMGKNTVTAIQSGIVLGYAGLVDSVLGNMKKEMGVDCPCIATGGLSEVLGKRGDLFTEVDIGLTVTGLAIIAESLQ
ncbi:MAG: type III pantothenate kinase [Treponema sp.]|nr:MAG: type III pantothenate kinase [Treponema sp.]